MAETQPKNAAGKKRSRPVPQSSQRSQKRQRIESAKNAPPTKSEKHTLSLDALPWNTVDLPGMLDDAEGFFGLEEVDDVEVVKEGNKVQFVSSKHKAPESIDEEEEFEGFGDDDEEVTLGAIAAEKEPVAPKAKETRTERKEKAAKEKKEKKKDKKDKKAETGPKDKKSSLDANVETNGEITAGAFSLLQDEMDEDETDVSAWSDLNLSAPAMSALAKLGFSKPTAIQKASLPEILASHDVVGKAATGSGKTLAFAIPVVEAWLAAHNGVSSQKTNSPMALILSPTRELAHQLSEHITAFCSGLPDSPYIATLTGGMSIQKQQRQLVKADIIIGTPGRLWEIIGSDAELNRAMSKIRFLVVDEADRLLSEGHFKEVEEILKTLDRRLDEEEETDEKTAATRQTLVFSATFNKHLQQKLAGKGRFTSTDGKDMEYLLAKLNFREERPKFVDANPVSQMAEGLKEGMVECAGTEKDLYLYALLMHHPGQRTLVFTNSIHSARRLLPFLQNLGLPVQCLHSQMIQKARLRALERFSAPKAGGSILIATDVAARGLDIPHVQLVIHYHLPRTADMYVHRSGRTARADATGSSILLCAPEEVVGTRRLVAKVHAQHALTSGLKKPKYYIRSLEIDRRVVARLKPRVVLSKKIADSALAKEKKGHDDDWVRNAAEELGVDYDSDEFAAANRKGRGNGREKREKEARSLSKAEVGAMRAELKALLAQRVNVGVSERYLTSGSVDIDALLKGQKGEFLGKVDGIGMDDA